MSTNLYWARVTNRPRKTLSTGLKWAIERKFGRNVVLGESHIGWLEGVSDANHIDRETQESCQTLIEVIREDGVVELWVAE